jgi:pyrroloquinoline quinone biosynthesis protein D
MTGTSESSRASRSVVDGASILRFAPHTRFRFDEVRRAWVVLAPERLLLPDEQAVEILQLIDGERSVDTIIEELARRYDAPREVIAADVVKMLQDLADKRVLHQ